MFCVEVQGLDEHERGVRCSKELQLESHLFHLEAVAKTMTCVSESSSCCAHVEEVIKFLADTVDAQCMEIRKLLSERDSASKDN